MNKEKQQKSSAQPSSSAASTGSIASGLSLPELKDDVKEDLEKQEYFHGFRPRKDLQHLLKEPHDFLVRVTDNGGGAAEIIVSVLNDHKKLSHLTLCYENGQWMFTVVLNQYKKKNRKSKEQGNLKSRAVLGFNSVCELIKYYKDHKTPAKAYLKRPILRPNWLITHDKVQYKVTDLLGSGNFCHVYHGKYKRDEQQTYDVAIKVCHEGKLATEMNDESKEARKAMITEAQVMAAYTHDCIVTMHGVAMAHQPILIVMEYCPGGNLEHHLNKSGDKIEMGERVVYALEAARGMRYLHDQGCIHRDLAARNCLISSKGTIKIADFGLSMVTKEMDKQQEEEPETSPQIPVRWMAPESLKKPMEFSVKSDVWSFGILLYEIFNNGTKPWPDEPVKKIATMIRKCQMMAFPEKSPQEVKDLVSTIWVPNPKDRPTIGKAYRKLFMIIKKRSHLPPADMKDWAVNGIPGVKRTEDGLAHLIGDETDDRCETRSNDEGVTKDEAEPKTLESAGQFEPAVTPPSKKKPDVKRV